MKINNRLSEIGEYHFKKIEDKKRQLILDGEKIYDFGIGEPDIKPKQEIIESLIEALKEDNFYKYPPYEGIEELKKAIIKFYKEVYEVCLSIEEVKILIGSKEGISNVFPAVCDIGDLAIIPSIGYPVYSIAPKLWGVETYKMKLHYNKGYLPGLDDIPKYIRNKAKLLMVNYPNNPTGAVSNIDFYNELHSFSKIYDIVICNDNAYGEILDYNIKPLSILSSGKENAVEFGSFSKTFSMTGFRLGYVVGDKNVLKRIMKIKTNVDSGQFGPIQSAGIRALNIFNNMDINNIYNERRREVEKILEQKKLTFFKGQGTFYVWVKVPNGYKDNDLVEEFLDKYRIIVTPGSVFGGEGEDYFRIALTKDFEEIRGAFSRIKEY